MEPKLHTSDQPQEAVTPSVSPSGAFLRMLYVEREVKGFAITTSEIRQIGSLNILATLFFSLGGGAVGYALGLWWDVTTMPKDPTVQTVGSALIKVCVFAAVICFAIGSYLAYTRKNEIDAILNESRS